MLCIEIAAGAIAPWSINSRPTGENGSAEYLREVLYQNPRRKRTGFAVTAS